MYATLIDAGNTACEDTFAMFNFKGSGPEI